MVTTAETPAQSPRGAKKLSAFRSPSYCYFSHPNLKSCCRSAHSLFVHLTPGICLLKLLMSRQPMSSLLPTTRGTFPLHLSLAVSNVYKVRSTLFFETLTSLGL